MEKNNTSSSQPATTVGRRPSLEIVASYELFDYLLDGRAIANQTKGVKHRYTKAEAFFDLLNRQRISKLTSDDGYMDSSVLLLANAWGWMRPTAKKFLDRLKELNVITLTPAGNRTVVRLNNILGNNTTMSLSDNNRINPDDGTPSSSPSGDVVRHSASDEPAATS